MTVVVRDESILIPYGVVKIDGCWVESIQERPTWHTHIAAGMYVLDRSAIEVVPRVHYDMPQLINKLASRGCVQVHVIDDYWADLADLSEYERVNLDHAAGFLA
jgi:NDP-sugar pyrophosphorylase family protein